MALATLANVLPRVIQILNANPNAYASTVSGDVGAYPYQAEVNLAALEADEFIAINGYFQSANDALSNPFAVTSPPLADQDQVPFHHGNLNKVEVTKVVLSLMPTNVSATTNLITSTAHGLTRGDLTTWALITGTIPAPFVELINYYAIVIDANTFKLASTFRNSIGGIAIDITDVGTGQFLLLGWQIGIEAKSLDDVTNAIAVGDTYVQSGAFDSLYIPQDGQIYTPAVYARVTYPEYTRTAVLQCRQAEEYLVICTTIRMLVKNASSAPFEPYIAESERGIQSLVTDGIYTQTQSANS